MAPLYMFVVGATGILRACELAHVCSLQCIQQNQCAKTVLLLSQAPKQKIPNGSFNLGGHHSPLTSMGLAYMDSTLIFTGFSCM